MKKDKLLHLGAGALVALLVLLLTGMTHAAVILTFLAGAGKEVLDHYEGGVFDWKDLAFTLAGGVTVTVLWMLL